MTAGTKDHRPIWLLCSMAGMSRLHTEAATITPAAKPVSIRLTERLNSFRSKNTKVAPSVVPMRWMSIPQIISDVIFLLFDFLMQR